MYVISIYYNFIILSSYQELLRKPGRFTMSTQKFTRLESYYFQGSVFLRKYDTNEVCLLGNVAELKLDITVLVIEHIESYTGHRGIDKVTSRPYSGTVNLIIEEFTKENLALALHDKHLVSMSTMQVPSVGYLQLKGIETTRGNDKVQVDLHRVVFDQPSSISNECNELDLRGSLQQNQSKDYDSRLGFFGCIVQL